MAEYIHLGTRHINSFGNTNSSQFWGDYYYAMYRDGTKMYYRLKARMTYQYDGSGSGYYNDPVVAIFKMNYDGNPKYEATKELKPANTGMMYEGYYWEVESDWFPIEKTSGSINCLISINNSNTWGFDNPDFYFTLGIVPALSEIRVNDGVYFDVDKGEGVPNTVPVVIKKYDASYTTKLKITSKNNAGVVTTIREYQDFSADTLTFTEEELQKYYASTPDWKMTILTFYLETFTSSGTSLGVFTDDTPAKVSDIDIKPIFSGFTYSDNNPDTYNLTGDRLILVKGYSNPRISVGGMNKATARKGASITKYSFVDEGQTIDYVLGDYPAYADLIAIKNNVLTVWAEDSRKESTKAEKLLSNLQISDNNEIIGNWVNYEKLQKGNFVAERDNGGTSSVVTLKWDGIIWDGTFGKEENKVVSAIYKYKKTESEDWIDGTTDLVVAKNGTKLEINQQIRGDLEAEGFDVEESYDIYIEVHDQLSKITDEFTMGVGSPALDIYGNCVSVGGIYDENAGGRFQGVYEVGDLYLTLNKESDPQKRFGGTWELIAKGKTLVGVDENDEDFNEAGKTGGGKEIQIPMQIYDDFLDFKRKQVQEIVGWENYRKQVAGTVLSLPNENCGEVIMGRNENSKDTNGNLPPYFTCYIWQRTA